MISTPIQKKKKFEEFLKYQNQTKKKVTKPQQIKRTIKLPFCNKINKSSTKFGRNQFINIHQVQRKNASKQF